MARHAQAKRDGTLETRERILAAARELFARHGYRGTTVRMIADRARLTDPAVYYYFPTKRDLYDVLLVEPLVETVLPIDSEFGSALDILVDLFVGYSASGDLARLLFREQLGGSPTAVEFRRSWDSRYRNLIGPFFRRYYGEAAGQLEDIVSLMLSGLFWDSILRYGDNFETVVRETAFQHRLRSMLQAVLPEMGCRPL